MISRLIQSRVLRLLGDLEGREGNSDFLLSDRCGGEVGNFSPWGPWEKNIKFWIHFFLLQFLGCES